MRKKGYKHYILVKNRKNSINNIIIDDKIPNNNMKNNPNNFFISMTLSDNLSINSYFNLFLISILSCWPNISITRPTINLW